MHPYLHHGYATGRVIEQVTVAIPRNAHRSCGKRNNAVNVTRQERPAVADKPERRLRNVCTVYVRAVRL